jgi:hypothetical protein
MLKQGQNIKPKGYSANTKQCTEVYRDGSKGMRIIRLLIQLVLLKIEKRRRGRDDQMVDELSRRVDCGSQVRGHAVDFGTGCGEIASKHIKSVTKNLPSVQRFDSS